MTNDRITAPKVYKDLCEHLQRHADKIDPKVHNLHIVMFGERGDDGLVRSCQEFEERMRQVQKRLDKYDENINKIVWMVGGSLIAAILNIILKITG